jgi:hypothetical protein
MPKPESTKNSNHCDPAVRHNLPEKTAAETAAGVMGHKYGQRRRKAQRV